MFKEDTSETLQRRTCCKGLMGGTLLQFIDSTMMLYNMLMSTWARLYRYDLIYYIVLSIFVSCRDDFLQSWPQCFFGIHILAVGYFSQSQTLVGEAGVLRDGRHWQYCIFYMYIQYKVHSYINILRDAPPPLGNTGYRWLGSVNRDHWLNMQ